MSYVCRPQSAGLALLLFVGMGWHEPVRMAAAAGSKPATKQGAAWETFTQPGGQTYFALKLSPQMAQPATAPHDLVVLFDTSASQIGGYREKALSALRSLLAGLPAGDRFALLAVDVNAVKLTASLAAPSGGAVSQALAALERRVPLGSTDMRQALETALATCLAANEPGRERSVVYIGDGFSTANPLSMETLGRIVAQFAEHRVSFSSYAIGPRIDVELLGALANHTGGMLVADDSRMTDRQIGGYLAAIARATVLWPTSTDLPAAMKDVYPRQTPPLRFDRDSVFVGTMDPRAAEARQPLPIVVQAELAGKPVTLRWNAAPEKPRAENAYLVKVVEAAAPSEGVSLPTVGSTGLNGLRRWVAYQAQQFATLGEQALAAGRVDDAARLADEAERLDPVNAGAAPPRAGAMRVGQPPANDLRLARAPSREQPAAEEPEAPEAGDGELINEIERQNRVIEGFLRREVSNALNQANAAMGVDPEGTRDRLKLLLDKVRQTAELNPEVRAQLAGKIEAGLRAASRASTVKSEQDLQRQQIAAEGEARQRINRELFLQEEKVDQLMSRFNALMDEERYRDAEALADIAEEMAPGRPGLRGAELTARMVGWTADMTQIRDMRHKGFVDATMQIELSHVPTADEPPILYPDPEVWQLLTERRKKWKAVDLTQHGPNESKILAALEEPTELDFEDTPLKDVVDYLKTRHAIEIQLDEKALTDAGVGSDTPVTRNIKGITLRSALKLVLSELDLTYLIRNEVLMITSKTEAENYLSMRVYPVGDLVIPVQSGFGGRGMFNVLDDGATEKATGLRAFDVKDDLNLTKKGKKPAPAPARPAASVKPAAKLKPAAPAEPAAEPPLAGPVQPAQPRRGKIEPIRVEFKEGDDIDAVWNDYFAAHTGAQAPAEAAVRETVSQLMKAHKFDHAIACIYAAMRHEQGQRWMYEALSIALQAGQRSPDEIERVLLSVLDFANSPVEVMYLAEYLARSGLEKRALQLFRQVSQVIPAAPEPYVAGLQLAQKLDDAEATEWATLGILGQPWPAPQIEVWNQGWNVASATLERLKSENRKDEMTRYKKAVDEALRRDILVVVSWNGEADVDLFVEEPPGTICSFRNPRTLSGGMMMGDSISRSKKDERKAQGAQEAYVCPKGFDGDYRIMMRRVWGKVTADKVTVDVYWHYWSKNERTMRKQIDLSGDEAAFVVDLKDGRRTEPLEQQQIATAVANAVANQRDVGRRVAQQLNAQHDPSVAGSMARSRARQPGELPRGLNPMNPFFLRGATGYQPVITTLPQGASMFTSAVVSADRRYVRVTPLPIFSVVSQVNTFNYVSGSSGSSGGGGQGGFGAQGGGGGGGGGGAGGLGGF